MRARALIVSLLVIGASFAGCIGMGDDSNPESTNAPTNDTPTNDTPTNQTPDVDEEPSINVTWFNTTVQGENIPGLGEYCAPECTTHQWSFDVPNGTQGLLVESFWEEDAEMRLGLNAPGDDCESNTANNDCAPEDEIGPSPLVSEPSEVPAGEWNLEVWPRDSGDQQVNVTVVVSVFPDDKPNGYTKIPE